MSEIRFDDRVAIITGAGGGLGRTYAMELARRGARVVVNDLGGGTDGTGKSTGMADLVVSEIVEAGGVAVASHDSVSTPEGGKAIVETAMDHFGAVDVVISNAGILRDSSLAKLTPEDLDVVIDVNLKGAFNVCQPAFKVMKERGYGRIVLTASSSGIFGNFGQANYAAAKSGLLGLSSVISIEGAKYGITCNVIAPQAVTRLTEALMGPLAEKLKPECVTPLVTFLSSESCQETHGIYGVGGGRFARIFIGMAPGYFAGTAAVVDAEDIEANFSKIRDVSGYTIPDNVNEEMAEVMKLIG